MVGGLMNEKPYHTICSLTLAYNDGESELRGMTCRLNNGKYIWNAYLNNDSTHRAPSTDRTWDTANDAYWAMSIEFERWAKATLEPYIVGLCAYDSDPIMNTQEYTIDTQQLMRCSRHPEWADDLNGIHLRMQTLHTELAEVRIREKAIVDQLGAELAARRAELDRLKRAGHDLTKLDS
jgi:hypothetical protein